jgi:hypothetical protein
VADTDKKETKEFGLGNVVTFIINGLFLVFFITSGILSFNEKKLVVSFFYFGLAALSVVPHRLLRVTQALKVVILIILFVILASVAAIGKPAAEQKYENYKLGQKFNVAYGSNTFSIVVKGMKNDAKISVSGKEITTSGYFIIVTGEITNLSSEAVEFKFKSDPELKDGQGRAYTLYGASIPLGKLQPSVAKEASYVFEVPKDASGLKFIAKDKSDIIKSVDLGR